MASIAEMTEVKWVTFQMGKREFPFSKRPLACSQLNVLPRKLRMASIA